MVPMLSETGHFDSWPKYAHTWLARVLVCIPTGPPGTSNLPDPVSPSPSFLASHLVAYATGHPILPVHSSLLDPSNPSNPPIFPISPSLPRPPGPPSELLWHCSGAGGTPFASLEITPALVHQLSWPRSCLARLASAVELLSNHCIPYIISCHICIQFSYLWVVVQSTTQIHAVWSYNEQRHHHAPWHRRSL